MTKEELLTKLTALRTSGDPEDAHCEADDLITVRTTWPHGVSSTGKPLRRLTAHGHANNK